MQQTINVERMVTDFEPLMATQFGDNRYSVYLDEHSMLYVILLNGYVLNAYHTWLEAGHGVVNLMDAAMERENAL